ncbi:MAG TPA: phenylacetate--CoA ligase family protein [Actinomycetes bacterium]|nr:phenylacetate--CoA ligase family protein [Actinomycetes bacterium]
MSSSLDPAAPAGPGDAARLRPAGTRGAPGEPSARPRERVDLPAGRRLLLRAGLVPVEWLLRLVGPRYRPFVWLITACPPRLLAAAGRWRAVRAYDHAVRRVPAYRRFASAAPPADLDPVALRVPATDKGNYVAAFSIPERCVGGRLPTRDVAVDESSGSTGTPFNWVRSLRERATTHTFISHFARHCFGEEPWITINAFSMGAWATGVNMGIALQRVSAVKSTGPDVDKILGTLALFGPGERYLVCGYPPFLKHLMDAARERDFPLRDYRLMGLVGGEGMSEGLRDYLSPVFQPVFSGYGATDLEIGMAGETPLSVAVRRAAREDPRLRRALFGGDPRLPMVFQYNPLSHHVTATGEGGLLVTINRLDLLSPRIAYDVHDEGGVASYAALEARVRAAGRSLADLAGPGGPAALRLPFLWIHGRKDSTVSVMGANIYPEDVEQALYGEPDLAAVTTSFCLALRESPDGTLRPCFAFELRAPVTPERRRDFQERIVAAVQRGNADFRTAMAEHAAGVTPVVELHPPGGGPFGADRTRIKQIRVVRTRS